MLRIVPDEQLVVDVKFISVVLYCFVCYGKNKYTTVRLADSRLCSVLKRILYQLPVTLEGNLICGEFRHTEPSTNQLYNPHQSALYYE